MESVLRISIFLEQPVTFACILGTLAHYFLLLYIFVIEKSEIPIICFNVKNYPSWPSGLNFISKERSCWGHIIGSDPKPMEDDKQNFLMDDQGCKNKILDPWHSETSSYFEYKTV